MATITVRNLSDATRDNMRVTAAKAGRSMESEARLALETRYAPQSAPLTTPERLARIDAMMRETFGDRRPSNVVDEFLAERREEARREGEANGG